MTKKIGRKDFIKKVTAAGIGTAVFPSILTSDNYRKEKLRIGFIGTGLRGQWLLDLASKRSDVDVPAICDIDNYMVQRSLKILSRNGRKKPVVYSKGERDYVNLIKRDDLDAVIIATPWEWHHEMAVASMNEGKHVGIEVPAAITVEGCWDIVTTAESTGKECMLLENVCYRRDIMAVLNMVRKGLFGALQ